MPQWLISIIDAIFALGMIINAVSFVPQIFEIYKNKNVDKLSIVTFIGFNIIQFVGILYGINREDYALAIGSASALITCGTVTVLIVKYRKRGNNDN